MAVPSIFMKTNDGIYPKGIIFQYILHVTPQFHQSEFSAGLYATFEQECWQRGTIFFLVAAGLP